MAIVAQLGVKIRFIVLFEDHIVSRDILWGRATFFVLGVLLDEGVFIFMLVDEGVLCFYVVGWLNSRLVIGRGQAPPLNLWELLSIGGTPWIIFYHFVFQDGGFLSF